MASGRAANRRAARCTQCASRPRACAESPARRPSDAAPASSPPPPRRALVCREHPLFSQTLASSSCDCTVGHLIGECRLNLTIADMTWTKAHHYLHRAGGLGWVDPSPDSMAVRARARGRGTGRASARVKRAGRTPAAARPPTRTLRRTHTHACTRPPAARAPARARPA
eukprot:6485790-Prymnesium_polylepis.1